MSGRIILDPDDQWPFIDVFNQLMQPGGELLETGRLSEKGWDADAFRAARALIVEQLSQSKEDLPIFEKYQWLAKQFNSAVCRDLSNLASELVVALA